MELLFRIAADVTVTAHLGYALFILLGQLLILAGVLRGWMWIRNRWFRSIHLAAILIVVAESLCGITCPLTTLEKWLRSRAGQVSYEGDFLANAIHELLFVDFSSKTLAVCYSLFGLLVLVTAFTVPPDWKPEKPKDSPRSS